MAIRKQNTFQKVSIKKRKRISVFFMFLVFSSFLWLLIKLSNVYSFATDIKIKLIELPADVWIKTADTYQNEKVTITANGYQLINLKFFTTNSLEIIIPLNAVPYRKQSQLVYYINLQNIKEIVTDQLGLTDDQLEFHDSELYLNVEPVTSKKVSVRLKKNLQFKPQFGQYGPEIIKPDSVEVFAPQNILDTLRYIPTKEVDYKDIEQSFDGIAELSFNPEFIRPKLSTVNYSVTVEKFTESSVKLKVVKPSKPYLKLFPDYVDVFFSVSIKDFGKISSDQFFVKLDTLGLTARKQFLSVKVFQKPEHITITRIQPEQVEYLILKQ